MQSKPSANLAANLKTLREARGSTQQQMSELSGIPRPTWANLESGLANPTLNVLVKAADALAVSVDELLGAPRVLGRFYAASELPERRKGKVRVRKLLPETIAGLELERMELPANSAFAGTPHTDGTREYLTCERGRIQLTTQGTGWILEPGDVVVFRGDKKHGYRNVGDGTAVAYSVIAFAPVAG